MNEKHFPSTEQARYKASLGRLYPTRPAVPVPGLNDRTIPMGKVGGTVDYMQLAKDAKKVNEDSQEGGGQCDCGCSAKEHAYPVKGHTCHDTKKESKAKSLDESIDATFAKFSAKT
jgi:hypothetical protein